MRREEARRILEDVKRNQRVLDGCPGPHEFEEVPEPGSAIPRTCRCAKCGGTTSRINAHWYKRGLEHARREAER